MNSEGDPSRYIFYLSSLSVGIWVLIIPRAVFFINDSGLFLEPILEYI